MKNKVIESEDYEDKENKELPILNVMRLRI